MTTTTIEAKASATKTKPAKKAAAKKAKSGASSGAKTIGGVVVGRVVKPASKPVKPAAQPKAAKQPKPLSGMQVIRRCLAEDPTISLPEIAQVLERAGVPKSAGTISAIMSDFKMVCQALKAVGRLN